jgi:hypothetical protein
MDNFTWNFGTDDNDTWFTIKHRVCNDYKKYIFIWGCHYGEKELVFDDITTAYYKISDKIKEHYKDLNFDEKQIMEIIKDENYGFTNYWLYDNKYDFYEDKKCNINNEILNLLDMHGIVICTSEFKKERDYNNNNFYFVLPHPYFNKMKDICKLKRIKQIGIKTSNKELECFEVLKLEYDDLQQQFKIPNTRYHADYYSKNNNLVIEFLGDIFHGNINIYPKEKFNKTLGKTYGQMNIETFKRFDNIHKNKFNIKYIWENDWNRYCYAKKNKKQKDENKISIIDFLIDYPEN